MRKGLKIVALSDNHTNLTQFQLLREQKTRGDIFIHAGDFTRYGGEKGFLDFFHELDRLDFKHKIVIAGNHEISLDGSPDERDRRRTLELFPCSVVGGLCRWAGKR
jgi:predicted phosphodiesterase